MYVEMMISEISYSEINNGTIEVVLKWKKQHKSSSIMDYVGDRRD